MRRPFFSLMAWSSHQKPPQPRLERMESTASQHAPCLCMWLQSSVLWPGNTRLLQWPTVPWWQWGRAEATHAKAHASGSRTSSESRTHRSVLPHSSTHVGSCVAVSSCTGGLKPKPGQEMLEPRPLPLAVGPFSSCTPLALPAGALSAASASGLPSSSMVLSAAFVTSPPREGSAARTSTANRGGSSGEPSFPESCPLAEGSRRTAASHI